MKLTFLGATETVTGSKYLLEHKDKKIMVDCGLFQGLKELRLRNWQKLPVNLSSIDAILLTHAHLDHSGYIPLLVKNGFKGKIYCSKATFDICTIILTDSGYIQESDARRANRYGYTKHKKALPLYTENDAKKSLKQFKTVDFNKSHTLFDNLSFTLSHSGHILGSSFIKISDGQTSILFSGDIGRPHDPIMKAPVQMQGADYLVVESTYGNRLHKKSKPKDEIANIINKTATRGGSIIIPAFAVGRAQNIIYYIYELKKAKAIPDIPVFLDSPMAINASELLCKYKDDYKMSHSACIDACKTATYTRTTEQSKNIYNKNNNIPKVIISASGMATGGRILHHLKHYIGDARNTILFTGYQAAGTRGARLVHGEKEIKIHGKMWQVRAQIEMLHNTSAHADYKEVLDWLGNFKHPPRKTFITHGEAEAATSLRMKIEDHLGWDAIVPKYLQEVEL